MTPPRKPQLRVQFTKLGKVRFTSHRDIARVWERAVRKIQLPIAYSEGFSPRAKLSFGLALPTVFESQDEYVDLTLERPVGIDGLAEALSHALPVGLDVSDIVALSGKVPSLQECVESTGWDLFIDGDTDDIGAWAVELLAADELTITRERKGKTRIDDVRPALLDLVVAAADEPAAPAASTVVTAHLATKPRALRPLELLAINTLPGTFVLGRRTHQYIAPIGARRGPLAFGAAEAPTPSLSCAS